jgi:hypothetical protein
MKACPQILLLAASGAVATAQDLAPRAFRSGLTFALPLSRHQSLKLYALQG